MTAEADKAAIGMQFEQAIGAIVETASRLGALSLEDAIDDDGLATLEQLREELTARRARVEDLAKARELVAGHRLRLELAEVLATGARADEANVSFLLTQGPRTTSRPPPR